MSVRDNSQGPRPHSGIKQSCHRWIKFRLISCGQTPKRTRVLHSKRTINGEGAYPWWRSIAARSSFWDQKPSPPHPTLLRSPAGPVRIRPMATSRASTATSISSLRKALLRSSMEARSHGPRPTFRLLLAYRAKHRCTKCRDPNLTDHNAYSAPAARQSDHPALLDPPN